MTKQTGKARAAEGTRGGRGSATVRVAQGAPARGRIKPGSAPDILCRVSLDLFSDQNYSSVTIKDIADATGFNASLIYYYFDSKEDLFMKTIEMFVEEAFEHFEEITRNASSAEDVISSWIELHIRQFVKLQKVAKISMDYASTHNRTPSVDRAIRQFYEKEAKLLTEAIHRGIREGVFAPVNAAETALFISTFLDGALFRNVMFPHFNYAAAIGSMRKIVLDTLRSGAMAGLPEA